MALDVLHNDILIHEQQLGDQLGESVHQERRSDFSLLLAMLTDDVRAHSQFKHPQTIREEKVTTTQILRKEFQLPDEAPLALKHVDELRVFNQAELIQTASLEQIKLSDVLNPKALAFRDDVKHIEQQVMSNTSLYCQRKRQQEQPNTRAEFNANAWLSAVNTAIVKAPLMEAYA